MAYARFFRLLAALALLAVLGLSTTWLLTDWFPTGNDEITHLQNAVNVAGELADSPVQGLRDAWMGRYAGEERYAYWPGAAYLATAPFSWLGGLRGPLFALLPALLLLLWAVGTGAHDLTARLPHAGQLGSIAAVEKRMGVGKKTSTMLQDAHKAAAWRAVLLALLPTVLLLELRHYTPGPFVACLAAVATTLLVLSHGFRHRGMVLAWAVVVALGLMSDRITMVFLVWAPVLVALLLPGPRKKQAINVGLALVVVGLLAGPFYYGWWRAWGGRIASQEASDPGAMGARLLDLASWIPLQGLGVAASVLMLLGLLGFLARKPGWDAALLCWIAALISPLPLLALTEEGQGGLVLYLVAPLAVLAGVGWGRSRVHTSAAGTTVLALGTVLAMAAHAVSGGLLALDLGPATPMADRQGEPRDDADQTATAWLEAEGGAAVLDLVQAKGIWAGHWLHYLISVQHPELEVDWPVRRLHAAYLPGRFVREPCALGHLLVIHHDDPWFDSAEIRRPLGFVGMDEAQRADWHAAIDLARRCYAVDRVAQAPMGARLTYLTRRDEVADLLAAQASRAAAATEDDVAIFPPVDSTESVLEPLPEGAGCPDGMVPVAGGAYVLGPGDDIEPIAEYFTPDRVAQVRPFCMDVYEFPNRVGELPKTNVSWEESRLLCEALGKRLCTVDEWESACRSGERWRYSYGPEYEPTRCFTEGARYYDTRDLRPIGGFPECVSPAGVHDLNGGVSEWVDAERPGPPFPPDPSAGDKPCHEIMGGTMWGATYGQDCLSRHWHAFGHKQDDDGFRCCAALVSGD